MTVRLLTQKKRYIGLSTDTKPTGVPHGSYFYEYDTRDFYLCYDGTNWVEDGEGNNVEMREDYSLWPLDF